MEMFLVRFLGICALFGASAASPCLDPADTKYRCEVWSTGYLLLDGCDITDDDLDGGDLASCLDNAGRELVGDLYLSTNALTTLPAGIFEGLTSLRYLFLYDNAITTLPAEIFEGLTSLLNLRLDRNALTTLPAGIFEGLTSLEYLYLDRNALTTLPAGIFEGLTSLEYLYLYENALTTLPAGIFEGLTSLEELWLHENALTTLPAGIFESLASLERLNLEGNDLECLPIIPGTLVELDDDATMYADGLFVDVYGEECGCSAVDVTDVCGTEICTPGPVGYTCDPAVSTPDPVLPETTAPEDPAVPTPASVFPATTAPEDPVLPATTAPEGTSPVGQDYTPIIAGVVSAVAVVALIALAGFLRWRRSCQKTAAVLSARNNGDDDHLERGLEQNPDFFPPATAPLAVSGYSASPHQLPSAPAPLGGEEQSSKEVFELGVGVHTSPPHEDSAQDEEVDGPPSEPAADKSSETATLVPTISTANMSTAEQEEVAQFRQSQRAADAVPVAVGTGASSSSTSQQSSGGDIGLGQAVLAAAQELARSCQIPGVSEAAGFLCVMANLFTDSRENDQASKSRLRQCRSIVLALKRADKVVDKGGDTMGEAARVLIEDVHDAIFDLVELIKIFQSKNKLSKLLLSTLFKRRQDELDAVVNQAIMRLQLGLQLQAGQDINSIKDSMKSMENGVKAVEHLSRQDSTAEATSDSVVEARRIRRQRKLDRVEIPEEHLFITTDLLGKGGFGEVYLADYNGHNAAAKVLHIAHDLGALDEHQQQRETRQRRAFLRELEAMIRLRSPNTVNVFGAVTSLPDRMVLVMELLPNGDLLTLLRRSRKPLPEEQARRIIGDICAGMAFLHGKNTVHGDLKSANVLLDGGGRAKIGDFGTSRWSQHTNSTGLATYTTKANQTTQMSLAWSAPEVLESGGSTYESDVYSFGIVVWEVVSRQLPWANKTRPREILSAVLIGIRPSFPVDAPADMVDIAKACWGGEPEDRTTFGALLKDMKAKGWHE